jgi:hypothetical protein
MSLALPNQGHRLPGKLALRWERAFDRVEEERMGGQEQAPIGRLEAEQDYLALSFLDIQGGSFALQNVSSNLQISFSSKRVGKLG